MDITSVVYGREGGYIVNGKYSVPNDSANRHYQLIQEWVAEGNIVTPFEQSEGYLPYLREKRIGEIKEYGTALCGARIEVLGDYRMVEFLAELWPVLNNPASNPDLAYVRDVVVFAKNRINTAKSATAATLENYDVTQDNWPA